MMKMQDVIVRTRSYTIINSDELKKCIKKHEARYRSKTF